MRRLLALLTPIIIGLLLIGGTVALLQRSHPVITPTPLAEAVVARVDDKTITVQEWFNAYAIDLMMSALTGQPAPTPEMTLERLINDALLLKHYPQPRPDEKAVADYLAELEASLAITDGVIDTRMEAMGLTRDVLTTTMQHLMQVQAARQQVQAETDESAEQWVARVRRSAHIDIDAKIKAQVLEQMRSHAP